MMRAMAVTVSVAVCTITIVLVAARGSAEAGDQKVATLPVGHVVHVSSKRIVGLGFGRKWPFSWTMAAERQNRTAAAGPVCGSVAVLGPLTHPPHSKAVLGPESGNRQCGPLTNGQMALTSVGIGGGSLSSPWAGKVSWKGFDIGVGLVGNGVDSVRVTLRSGASRLFKVRHLSKGSALPGAEPFGYVVFAVMGCVKEGEALADGQMTARVQKPPCTEPIE